MIKPWWSKVRGIYWYWKLAQNFLRSSLLENHVIWAYYKQIYYDMFISTLHEFYTHPLCHELKQHLQKSPQATKQPLRRRPTHRRSLGQPPRLTICMVLPEMCGEKSGGVDPAGQLMIWYVEFFNGSATFSIVWYCTLRFYHNHSKPRNLWFLGYDTSFLQSEYEPVNIIVDRFGI